MTIEGNLTIAAVGLAMDMAQLRAETASHNIARANMPGARMERADFGNALSVLQRIAGGDDVSEHVLTSASMRPVVTTTGVGIDGTQTAVNLDQEVAEMALAGAHYQALTEALNRQFGLMSLALSGDQA